MDIFVCTDKSQNVAKRHQSFKQTHGFVAAKFVFELCLMWWWTEQYTNLTELGDKNLLNSRLMVYNYQSVCQMSVIELVGMNCNVIAIANKTHSNKGLYIYYVINRRGGPFVKIWKLMTFISVGPLPKVWQYDSGGGINTLI